MNDAEVSKINAAIRTACRDIMPYNAIREDAEGGTQVIADIIQDVWVRTLEKGDIGGRAFAIETKNVIRDWMRRELPMMPVSQMTLQPADAEDEDSELLMPWDYVTYGNQLSPEVEQLLNEIKESEKIERLKLRKLLHPLMPEDRLFLLTYERKKRRHSAEEMVKYKRLMEKVRRRSMQ